MNINHLVMNISALLASMLEYVGNVNLAVSVVLKKKMTETTKIRVIALEGMYASLEDFGVPVSIMSAHACRARVKLCDAQWTARHSLGGFSVSF